MRYQTAEDKQLLRTVVVNMLMTCKKNDVFVTGLTEMCLESIRLFSRSTKYDL